MHTLTTSHSLHTSKAVKLLPRSLGICLSVLILSGCLQSSSWILGDWIVDGDRTKSEATNDPKLSQFPPQLAEHVSSMIEQLQKTELLISSDKFVYLGGGQIVPEPYKLLQGGSDVCTVEKDKGPETYFRDGNEFYSFARVGYPGGQLFQFKVYMKHK